MSTPATRVLLMAYGTPSGPEAVEPYLRHMRGGRAPSSEAVSDLQRRYRAIGGRSPLRAITEAQGRSLERELNRRGAGPFRVHLGMKHAPPFIEEAAATILGEGPGPVVGLVLAPHYSALSVGEYLQRASAALAAGPGAPRFIAVTAWHLEPGFVAFLGDRVRRALDRLPAPQQASTLVVFTAHSLPERTRRMGDPYPAAMPATARAVADRLGLARWSWAWQSAAATGEPWLGPSLDEVITGAAGDGSGSVVVCPCGFTADHLEVLYDIDVEARERAVGLGLLLERTDSPNDDPAFITVLADVVLAAVGGTPGDG